jgi:hypothetical protein
MFTDRLTIELTLTIDGAAHTVPGGNVTAFALDLANHGFTGSVEFVLESDQAHGGDAADELLTAFLGQSLIEVSLSVAALWDSPETSTSLSPLVVAGLVREKSLTEVKIPSLENRPVLYRRYHVDFADPAAVLWSQHFPTVLYTAMSPQAVIDDHKGEKIAITYDSTTLGTEQPLFFVHLEPRDGASFRDFVLWYLDARGYVWGYDYTAKGYTVADAKDATGEAESLFGDDVAETRIVFPAVQRASAAVLNSFTDGAQNRPIAQAQAVGGVRRDFLMRSAIAKDFDDRLTLETRRLVVRSHELALTFGRMPTIGVQPGTLLKLEASNLWSQETSVLAPTWRVRRYHLEGHASDPRPDRGDGEATTTFDLQLDARLEQADEAHVDLPPFVSPTYPGLIEGKIKSEQGEETDVTYEIYTDDDTQLESYKIIIPLWKDQVITAPFAPHLGSGNVYVPAYKNARVLVAIGLETAEIAELLDWRAGARLDMDVQGEQILFGKSATSNTSVNHVYDGESPVLNVARVHDKDTATIQLMEGVLLITVKENEDS